MLSVKSILVLAGFAVSALASASAAAPAPTVTPLPSVSEIGKKLEACEKYPNLCEGVQNYHCQGVVMKATVQVTVQSVSLDQGIQYSSLAALTDSRGLGGARNFVTGKVNNQPFNYRVTFGQLHHQLWTTAWTTSDFSEFHYFLGAGMSLVVRNSTGKTELKYEDNMGRKFDLNCSSFKPE